MPSSAAFKENPLSEQFEMNMLTRLAAFETFDLSEAAYAFHDRKEAKYLLNQEHLLELLDYLNKSFRLLAIEGQKVQIYRNRYFDTEDFAFYHMHHNGLLNRFKVRERCYSSSTECFLELKTKSNKARTQKQRVALDQTNAMQHQMFLQENLPKVYWHLKPSLQTNYKRISLMSHAANQRLTIDFALELSDPAGQKRVVLDKLAIIELKEEKQTKSSSFEECKRQFRLQETSFSKYCMGCCLVYAELKQNEFKPMVQKLKKVHNGF